jgi:hypothetical protein
VENTKIRNCGIGVRTNSGTGAGIKATIANSVISRNTVGVDAQNGTLASVYESTVSNNTSHGLQVAEPTAGSNLNVVSTNISNNGGTGINVVGSSRARIARCNIFQNNVSLAPANLVDSGGNNSIAGNTTNTAPAGPSPFPQN